MKLFLLKILLQRRARDDGFTLPMVIALGLVMVLLGTVNIVKSSEENLNAIALNSSSDALAVAEVGVTKYRELLNQNRILTVYNHDQWTTNANVTGQTCDNIATTPTGWEDGGGAAAPNDTTKWWEIRENIDGTAGDETIGEYKLVSYIYDIDNNPGNTENGNFNVLADVNANFPTDTSNDNDSNDDGESDARGILTVQGRSQDGSEAQIQVDIPLRINDLENFEPVLWVGNGSITNFGGTNNLNITNGNIVFSNAGGGCPGIADIDGNNVVNEPRSLPAIIDTSVILAADKNTDITDINLSNTDSELLLPRPQSPADNKTSDDDDGRFLYEITSLNITDNNLVTDGVAKVTLYVAQNINITASTKDVNIGNFDNSTNNISSHNLEIYGTNNTTQINIDTSGGTVNIEAFIHAPSATLNVSGSGTVNINGALWINDINNTGGAEINITGDQTDTTIGSEPSYKFYTTIANRTPRPITSSPTNWEREEVE